MANLFGANYTTQDPVGAGDTTGTVPAAVDVAEWGGRVRVCYDRFTNSSGSTTGATDVLYLGKIPANATFLYGIVEHDSSGSVQCKVEVGATEVRANAGVTINVATLFGKAQAGLKTTALTDVKVTLANAGIADTKYLSCMIFYTVD